MAKKKKQTPPADLEAIFNKVTGYKEPEPVEVPFRREEELDAAPVELPREDKVPGLEFMRPEKALQSDVIGIEGVPKKAKTTQDLLKDLQAVPEEKEIEPRDAIELDPMEIKAEKDEGGLSKSDWFGLLAAAALPAFGQIAAGTSGAGLGGAAALKGIGGEIENRNKERIRKEKLAIDKKKANQPFELEKMRQKGREKLQTERLDAQAKAKKEEREIKKSEKRIKSIDDLRKERNRLPITKDTQSISQAYNKIQTVVSGEPSAAGDLSLIFNYMKMLDPGSTVREGEQATAASARGVPDSVRTIYNRLLSGERLAENQRNDFLGQASNLFKSQIQLQSKTDDQFLKIGKNKGFTEDELGNVIINFNTPIKERAAKQPSQGQLVEQDGNIFRKTDKGYEFVREAR